MIFLDAAVHIETGTSKVELKPNRKGTDPFFILRHTSNSFYCCQ
jgi:hypothetical protein